MLIDDHKYKVKLTFLVFISIARCIKSLNFNILIFPDHIIKDISHVISFPSNYIISLIYPPHHTNTFSKEYIYLFLNVEYIYSTLILAKIEIYHIKQIDYRLFF